MFGYVVLNKPEIKFKDFDEYRSFYCGLCRELKERHGFSGQISLTYDLTFAAVLLSGLYEPPTEERMTRCIVHPVHKQQAKKNEILEYTADMNVLLTYYKCMDDWKDERSIAKLGYAKLLNGSKKRLQELYPAKADRILSLLEELSDMEKADEQDMDMVSGCFGRIMEEIFVYREDEWEQTLRRMGFFLGKFIYLLDAYDDVEEDVKNGNYNPFSKRYKMEAFEEQVRGILMMMISEACREFEKLPIIKYTDILRNILYSGVWSRFEAVSKKRREAREKKND